MCWDLFENRQEAKELKKTFLVKEPEEEEKEEPGKKKVNQEPSKKIVPLVDLEALHAQYPDVQAWLTIPDTGVDYPVLQNTEENSQYYLKRNYKKEWDINGSLFFQWNCEIPEGDNLIIYGHNMNSGAQFGNLDLYTDPDYEKTHSRIYLQTMQGVKTYRIAAVLKADVSMFPFQQTVFQTKEDLTEYIRKADSLELYPISVPEKMGDQILTLVTCAYEWKDARLILVAVKEL